MASTAVNNNKQTHGRFQKNELNLKTNCQESKGNVVYKCPHSNEQNENATRKRRRGMENELFCHMDEEEKYKAAMDRQSRGRFQEIEALIEKQCDETKESLEYLSQSFFPVFYNKRYAGRGVRYIPPSRTESQPQTDYRRRKLRRRLTTHWIIYNQMAGTRQILIEMEDKVRRGLESKYARSEKSWQMVKSLKAFEKASLTNSLLTINCKYPGKKEGIHCPCRRETMGYLTIARAIALLNMDNEMNGLPSSWKICRNKRCRDEYTEDLFDLILCVTGSFPTNLNKLCVRLDRDRPPEDMLNNIASAGQQNGEEGNEA